MKFSGRCQLIIISLSIYLFIHVGAPCVAQNNNHFIFSCQEENLTEPALICISWTTRIISF